MASATTAAAVALPISISVAVAGCPAVAGARDGVSGSRRTAAPFAIGRLSREGGHLCPRAASTAGILGTLTTGDAAGATGELNVRSAGRGRAFVGPHRG